MRGEPGESLGHSTKCECTSKFNPFMGA
jgi:hypothetical protein